MLISIPWVWFESILPSQLALFCRTHKMEQARKETLLLLSDHLSEYHNHFWTWRKHWVTCRSGGPHTGNILPETPFGADWSMLSGCKSKCIIVHTEWRLNEKAVSSNLCKYESLFKALVSPLIKTNKWPICLKAWSISYNLITSVGPRYITSS